MTASKASTPPRDLSLLWALGEHSAEIANLHSAIFEKGWDEASVGRMLGHPGSVAMLAMSGTPRTLVGFVLAQVAADEAEILSIGVAADRQRQGIGARLVEGAQRAAKRAGATRMFLEVAPSNTAALALYGRTGFRATGVRKDDYTKPDGSTEDAVVLSADLAGVK